MRKEARRILAGALLIGSAWAQDRGIVTGTVLDEHGSPLAQAKVHIAEKAAFAGHRLVQFHESDAEGHFHIAHVHWGTYIVIAGKEDAGYPDTKFAFYSNNTEPVVVLTEDSPTVDVTLKLGPKAGVLDVAPVTDQVTGKEIRSASITLRRADNDLFISTSTTVGRILVPSLTGVEVTISAPGYKSWPPADTSVANARLFLQPEQIQRLQVSLEPDEGAHPSDTKQ
jgi:Carboxypeptidase regulatory-like domain